MTLPLFELADGNHEGVLVALWLTPDAAEALAMPGGEDPDSLHITLCYCDGNIADALPVVEALAQRTRPLTGVVNGLGSFEPSESSDGKRPIYAVPDVDGIEDFRAALAEALTDAGVVPRTPGQKGPSRAKLPDLVTPEEADLARESRPAAGGSTFRRRLLDLGSLASGAATAPLHGRRSDLDVGGQGGLDRHEWSAAAGPRRASSLSEQAMRPAGAPGTDRDDDAQVGASAEAHLLHERSRNGAGERPEHLSDLPSGVPAPDPSSAGWVAHVTLVYIDEGDPVEIVPDPPAVDLIFDAIWVIQGDEEYEFRFEGARDLSTIHLRDAETEQPALLTAKRKANAETVESEPKFDFETTDLTNLTFRQKLISLVLDAAGRSQASRDAWITRHANAEARRRGDAPPTRPTPDARRRALEDRSRRERAEMERQTSDRRSPPIPPPGEPPPPAPPRSRKTINYDNPGNYPSTFGGVEARDIADQLTSQFPNTADVRVSVNQHHLTVRAEATDPEFGFMELTRRITRSPGPPLNPRPAGDLTVYHAYFKVQKQGAGFGKRVMRDTMNAYQRMGVKEMSVSANIDIGAYAWAKYGFKATHPEDFARTMLDRAERLKTTGKLTARQYATVETLLRPHARHSTRGEISWDLADLELGGVKIGKKVMVDADSWSGHLKLDDAVAMTKFTTYVNRPDKTEAEKQADRATTRRKKKTTQPEEASFEAHDGLWAFTAEDLSTLTFRQKLFLLVDPVRSQASRDAWITIRANRAARYEAERRGEAPPPPTTGAARRAAMTPDQRRVAREARAAAIAERASIARARAERLASMSPDTRAREEALDRLRGTSRSRSRNRYGGRRYVAPSPWVRPTGAPPPAPLPSGKRITLMNSAQHPTVFGGIEAIDIADQLVSQLPSTARVSIEMLSNQMSIQAESTSPETGALMMTRRISRSASGNLTVYHSYLHMSKQDAGVGKRILRDQFNTYKRMDVKEVTVSANIDIGSYAWARYGFKAVYPHDFARSMLNRADRHLRDGKLTAPEHAKIKALLDTDAAAANSRSTNHEISWHLSDLTLDGVKIGKKIMVNAPSWNGSLKLNDVPAMTRFTKYVNRPDKTAAEREAERKAEQDSTRSVVSAQSAAIEHAKMVRKRAARARAKTQ